MAVGSYKFHHPKRTINMTSFRVSYKFVLQHPFLVILVFYFILLHRYFPFLFSLLLTASPVIICTAVLLGALLIHGQKNIHTAGDHGEMSNMRKYMNSGVSTYAYTTNRDMNFSKDRFAEVRHDIVQKEMRLSRGVGFGSSMVDTLSKADREYDTSKFSNRSKFPEDNTKEYISSFVNDRSHVANGSARESSDSESDGAEKSALDALVANVILTPQETHPLLESTDPISLHPSSFHETMFNDSLKSELQSIDSNQSSEDVDEDESPKTKLDDHQSPFEWTDNDQRILQQLRKSEMEKNEHLESLIARAEDDGSEGLEVEVEDRSIEDNDEDIEEEEDDDEEDEHIDVEKDASKHVTMWTEEDEKNLRHLGCSELERNLRLENLLARRRTQRNFSMISERNLIDLDLSDLPFQVAPISTTRLNPFDVPNDANQHPNVATIPGSAPSTTVPRKNPFGSPSTSPKGSHQNLNADRLKEQTVETNMKNGVFHGNESSATDSNPLENVIRPDTPTQNRKDALFRRYESFSTGYNFMEDAPDHDLLHFDRRDLVFRRHETFSTRSAFPSIFSPDRPVFVPEQTAHEARHHSLSRQSSQDSESVESARSSDTESSSIAPVTHEDEEHDRKTEAKTDEYEGLDRETELMLGSESPVTHKHEANVRETEVTFGSVAPTTLKHDGHSEIGSESSKSIDSQHGDQDEPSTERTEVNVDHLYVKEEIPHDNHDTTSSSSEHDVERSVIESDLEHSQVEVPGFSTKDSLSVNETNMITDNEIHPVEPVYDTSPSCTEKSTVFSSPLEEQHNK